MNSGQETNKVQFFKCKVNSKIKKTVYIFRVVVLFICDLMI